MRLKTWKNASVGALIGLAMVLSDLLLEWRGPKYLPWEGEGSVSNAIQAITIVTFCAFVAMFWGYRRYLSAVRLVRVQGASDNLLQASDLSRRAAFSLSGWQRVGIIISVLWIVGAIFWAMWVHVTEPRIQAQLFFASCTQLRPLTVTDCAEISENLRLNLARISFGWRNALLLALGPLPAAWLLGWAILAIWHWVRRGF